MTALAVTLDAQLILAVVVKSLTAVAVSHLAVVKQHAADASHPADAKQLVVADASHPAVAKLLVAADASHPADVSLLAVVALTLVHQAADAKLLTHAVATTDATVAVARSEAAVAC